jgi:proprotein convertase subtilisin/kexin type 5
MTVYTEIDGTSYHIDTIQGELSLEWKCSMPCETCYYDFVGGDSICDSCNLMSNRTILFENQCFSECPGATYYDPVGNTCNQCDPTCAECDDLNPLICLSCNKQSG